MYYLGIDGGGTKTKFTLCDNKGKILTSTIEPTSHYLQVGFDGVTEVINNGINDICKKANISRNDIDYAFVGAAGYGDVKDDCPKIISAVSKAMNGIKHTIGNDGENALAGALAGDDGINIIAGTGSIGFGYNSKTNQTLSCGGWNHLIGSDEGSGFWFAYKLLHEFTRQADGRDEKTPLYDAIKNRLDLKEDGQVISVVIEEWKFDRTKVASLSTLINDLINKNDPYAEKIIDEAGKELADIVNSLYKKLDFNSHVKASYTGGMFNIGDKLTDALRKYLLPNIELVPPLLDPDVGCLVLALKNNGITIDNEILNNLKK